MKLEKTFREQGILSQAVVRIVNEAANDQEDNGDAGGSRNVAEVTETRRTKSIWHEKQLDCDSVEQHPSVQNPGAQAQSKQKRTRDQ